MTRSQPSSSSDRTHKSPRLAQRPGTSKLANVESMGNKRRCDKESKGPKNKKQKICSKKVPNDDETEDELEDTTHEQVYVRTAIQTQDEVATPGDISSNDNHCNFLVYPGRILSCSKSRSSMKIAFQDYAIIARWRLKAVA